MNNKKLQIQRTVKERMEKKKTGRLTSADGVNVLLEEILNVLLEMQAEQKRKNKKRTLF